MRRSALVFLLTVIAGCGGPASREMRHVFGYTPIPGNTGGGCSGDAGCQFTGATIAASTVNGIDAGNMTLSEQYLEDFEGWKREAYREARALDPSLIYCWAKPAGPDEGMATAAGPLSTASDDGNVEGGGDSVAANTYKSTKYSVFQNTAGGHIAIFGLMQMTLPTSGVVSLFGAASSSAAHFISICSRNSLSSTNMVGLIIGTGTTSVTLGTADGAWHTQMYSDDATTLRFLQDGTVVGSTTTRTNLTTEPMYLFWFNDTLRHIRVRWFGMCSAQPPT